MSYPHTRVSATGQSPYYDTPEDYAARASWKDRVATGWVRSVGVDPVRIHESADKVHLAGGWTRYNVQDEPILRNRVTYIFTRIEGSWGIQARFGTDSFTEGEVVDSSAPVGVVAAHLENWAAGGRCCGHGIVRLSVHRCPSRAGRPLRERVGSRRRPLCRDPPEGRQRPGHPGGTTRHRRGGNVAEHRGFGVPRGVPRRQTRTRLAPRRRLGHPVARLGVVPPTVEDAQAALGQVLELGDILVLGATELVPVEKPLLFGRVQHHVVETP